MSALQSRPSPSVSARAYFADTDRTRPTRCHSFSITSNNKSNIEQSYQTTTNEQTFPLNTFLRWFGNSGRVSYSIPSLNSEDKLTVMLMQ